MRLFFYSYIFSLTSISYSQNDTITKYRFGVSLSALSTMNYGLKSFYNISSLEHYRYSRVYYDEKYTVDYQNFNFSKDFDVKLHVNWINSKKYILRQSFSAFIGSATERVELTLTSYGDKTGVESYSSIHQGHYQYWANNLAVGYQTNYELKSKYIGFVNELVLLKKNKNDVNVGMGLSVISRTRSEFYPLFDDGYFEHHLWDVRDQYFTRQLCVSAQLEKQKKWLTGFVSFSQSFFTLKVRKGHRQVMDGKPLAVSNNLDYRFPLYIKAGLTLNFDKIKN